MIKIEKWVFTEFCADYTAGLYNVFAFRFPEINQI
jgi:hypothetical protein